MAGLQADDAIFQGLAEAKHNDVLNEKSGISAETGKLDDEYHHDSSSTGGATELDEDAPTEEEKHALRRVPGTVPWPAYLIASIELVERFSYYGSTVVFTNFIQRPLPAGSRTGAGFSATQSGALGMGQQAATGLTTMNTFWVYCVPLAGAYVADAHLGRYNTIMISVVIATIGHILLVVSAVPTVLTNQHTSLGIFIVAIIIMGLGTGGFKPNISPLVAEQIENKQRAMHTKVLKNGEKVIVDPTLTAGRVYMYFYLAINIGALVGQIAMAYAEKYVGFWLAYFLPTALFLLCPLVMILGRPLYVIRPPTGSVFGQAVRVWRFAMKGRWTANPVKLLRNLKSDEMWEAAKPSNVPVEKQPGWMAKIDDQWVMEVKRGLAACKVFLWFPLYWLSYNQLNNNLTSQAGVMNTHGLPNDILSNLDPLALIILIPICDLLIYPALRRAGINFSPIKKITGGFITGALGMMCAAIVQHNIYKQSECGKYAANTECAPVNINVWVQTPSYLLIAISEILASITGLEYAFTLAPKNMRSIVMSVFLFMSAISAAIGEAFNPLSADPLLVWNYGAMGVIAFIAGIAFWFCNRDLDRDHNRLVELKEGHSDGRANVQDVMHSSAEQGIIPRKE